MVGTWEYLYGDSGGDKDSLWWTKLKLKSKKTLNQFNSGYPIKFANTAASVRAGGVAFSGVITVRAHTKSSSDAVRHTLNVVLNK